MAEDFDTICELEFVDTQTGKKLTARLGPPIFDPAKGWYVCLTEVLGLNEGRVEGVPGGNAFQAICMSLERFRLIFARQAGDFRSGTGDSPHMFFTRRIPWVYGSDVYQKLCGIVDVEVKKIEDERTRRRESGSWREEE